jgi:hypothetical protein
MQDLLEGYGRTLPAERRQLLHQYRLEHSGKLERMAAVISRPNDGVPVRRNAVGFGAWVRTILLQ